MNARRLLNWLLEAKPQSQIALNSQVTAQNGAKGIVTQVGVASWQTLAKLPKDHRALLSGTVQVKWSDGTTSVVPVANVTITPPRTTPPPLPATAAQTPAATTPSPPNGAAPAAQAPASAAAAQGGFPGVSTVFGNPVNQPAPAPAPLSSIAQSLVRKSGNILIKVQALSNPNDPALQPFRLGLEALLHDLNAALSRLP